MVNIVHKNIEYISDGNHMFMKGSTCTYGYYGNLYEQLWNNLSSNQDIIEHPSDIYSKISIPIHYLRIKSAYSAISKVNNKIESINT